jgi:metallo-beta-lactamase family protein
MLRVEFLGGVRTVTGSATLLEKGSFKWLVDCGIFQGNRELEERNWKIQPYHPEKLSYILLTHAHIDHSGLFPKLVKEGFRGKVICTQATLELCEVILQDSGHIQEMETEWRSRKNKRCGLGDTGLPAVKTVRRDQPEVRRVGIGTINA